jgi:hypothetical protein
MKFARRNAFVPPLLAILTAGAFACRGSNGAPAPEPDAHPLGGILGQPLMIAPVQRFSVARELGWSSTPQANSTMLALDSALADTLRARIGSQQWVYAATLEESFRANPTYATDPRALSVQPLRGGHLQMGGRLPEPLASQLRTMIALQEGRLVMIPIDLRVDAAAPGVGRPVVSLVLVDPRASVLRWSGEVTGADTRTFTTETTAILAGRIADLFVAK